MTKALRAVTIALALVVLAAGCQSLTGRTFGQNIDDKSTVAAVKTKLAADKVRNLTWVHVDVTNGVVYLNGNAETPEEKTRAEEIARRVDGVKQVVNQIQVKGAAAASPPIR
jgi:osmotically-inducible protein OsmY